MDVTLKEKIIGDNAEYVICLEEQIRYNKYVYYVCLCPKKAEHYYGYPINSGTYSDRKLADKAFYRYCRKAKELLGLV